MLNLDDYRLFWFLKVITRKRRNVRPERKAVSKLAEKQAFPQGLFQIF